MTPTEAMAAARVLASAWRRGEHIEALPASCRPMSRADGYAIQDEWPEEVGAPVAGWKIAATSEAGQRHIQVSGPLAGPVFAHRVRGDAAQVSLEHVGMKVAECEVVFRMSGRFAPRGRSFSRDEVMAAIAAVHPGIEIPDSRFRKFEDAGESQLIADCACMNEMLIGAAMPADADRMNALPSLVVRATKGTGEVRDGIGANALGDPVEALVWLVNELVSHGRTLDAGQFVTTGTCLTPIPITGGDTLSVDYGWLGRLSARFD